MDQTATTPATETEIHRCEGHKAGTGRFGLLGAHRCYSTDTQLTAAGWLCPTHRAAHTRRINDAAKRRAVQLRAAQTYRTMGEKTAALSARIKGAGLTQSSYSVSEYRFKSGTKFDLSTRSVVIDIEVLEALLQKAGL